MPFELATAGRVIFGAGRLRDAGEIVGSLGKNALVVIGRTGDRARPLLDHLCERGVEASVYAVPGEPEIDMIREGTALARSEGCDCVIGFGGGSALDAAKAIAILATNTGDVLDYLEIIGRGKQLTEPALPFIAIPTTAGTGSEVTANSVVISPKDRVKVSLRSPLMLAKVALVDPELTHGLPPGVTATTGLDALTQLIEPFVCRWANPLTDGLCREGMVRVARSLRIAYASVREIGAWETAAPEVVARQDMAVASLFGGLALANAGLGAVHGIAGPLGGMITAPHGALCAALLPKVVTANLRALRTRDRQNEAIARYDTVARILIGNSDATADDAVEWLQTLVDDLDIPGLAAYGMTVGHIPELIEKAARAGSMKGNPVELALEELAQIIEAAL
jgi:alcohol dehydrogenase class IV